MSNYTLSYHRDFRAFPRWKVEYIYVYDRGAKKIGKDSSFRSLHIYIYPSKYTSLLDNMDNFRGKGGFLSKGARKKKEKEKDIVRQACVKTYSN